ncbi:peroxidasin homolog [Corticium candelabrum]|uniref:peroxidasin homolog n=1 Tax=Corticium candelabrum TaxID=121492 RepID=UPI002E258512|nr:peroxidasin homolog [Corticium candelabrum]
MGICILNHKTIFRYVIERVLVGPHQPGFESDNSVSNREEPADTVSTHVGPDQLRTATLYCRTNSQDKSTITTWYKDDVNVEDGSLPFYNVTKDRLVVQTTDSHDTGESLEGLYYCVINNVTVAVRSKSAYIRGDSFIFFVSPSAGAFSTQATVAVAQSGYLQLPVSDNRPFCCPFWHDVSVTGRLVVFSVLRIRYSEIRNNIDKCRKESTIRVIGTIGTPKRGVTFTFKDTISLVPRAYIQNQNIFVKVGSNATLYCISSHITSSYTWSRDGSVIVVGMRFSLLIDGVLHIQNVTEQDNGQYECTATATFPSFGVVTRKVSWSVTVYSVPRVTLSLSQLNDTRTEQICNTTNLVVPCILNHLPTTVKCQAKGSFPMLIQLSRNVQLLLKQNVTNANHAVQHTISSPRSEIYQCIARNEYGSKQSSLYATVSGVVPTVSVTSRSSTTAATFPSIPQSTDYVTTSQSAPRASSTSTSSSYSSQLTNATSHNVQSTSGTKSPRVTSAPVTVTQANASSVSLSSSSSTLNLPTTSTPRTSSSSQRTDLIPTTSTVFPTSQTASPPSHHTNTPSSSGAAKPASGKVTSAATSGDASKSATRPATKATTPTGGGQESGRKSSDLTGVAVSGWVVSVLLFGVILIMIWINRKHQKSSQKESEETTMRENPAYNFISSHARGGTAPSSTDAVQYEEVGMDATKRQRSYENIANL